MVLEEKTQKLAEKDTQLQLAKLELRQLKHESIIQFFLGVISALLSSVGVNLVTANPPVEPGWIMIGAAVVLQVISLAMTYLARRRKSI